MFFGYIARKSELSTEEIEQKFHPDDVGTESLISKIMSTYYSIIAKGKSQEITQEITIEKVNGIIKPLKQSKLSVQDSYSRC